MSSLDSEWPFRIAFCFAFAAALTIAANTARRATARHGGSINQLSNEIKGLVAARAALGIIFYAMLVAWMFWPEALRWSYLPLPSAARWTAVALLLPAIGFFAWSFRALGDNYRGGVGLYHAHELVTTGPYRWIRHPIYAAFIGIMLLLLVLTANWVIGASGLLLVSSIAAARIPVEERELRARFGEAWESYRSRTGLLVPRLFTAPAARR